VIVLLTGSTARMRFMRERLISTAVPLASGMLAPQWLVLPPCGTIATPACAQKRTIAETSSVVAGRTTHAPHRDSGRASR
jgi:hypothetical protein